MVENNDLSSASSLAVVCKLSERSFMYIGKSNGAKIEPCGSRASTDDQLDYWHLRITRWNLLPKKLLSRLRRIPDISIRSSLTSKPSCDTLSNASEIYKQLALTSNVGFWSKLA